ncbi:MULTISPECIES: hypothetical protein [Subtercola]|uniref:Uncharacterized protein n=1 Tax=Subtercola vilae TaxID=2056433 RepID=A0A4T2C1E3_9MICO|nr:MULTISPECIES: hypothetical protein [Subtercola]MEA9985912.1 hypothetical protein [Subtercola sp. RTI3]TIH36901.1 hypothetical protein D4765_09145 [Subtercola vilae]
MHTDTTVATATVKPLPEHLVRLPEDCFCPEACHALALFGHSPDPDLRFSEAALRRFGRPRPSLSFASGSSLAPSGMRVSFDTRSFTRLEVFYEQPRKRSRAPAASIRTSRVPQPVDDAAFADPGRSTLTEHAVSYLIRNDMLPMRVPSQSDHLDAWHREVHRATHYVSDMRRRDSHLVIDGVEHPVTRIEDPFGRWAAVVFEYGPHRVSIAGASPFLRQNLLSISSRPQSNRGNL